MIKRLIKLLDERIYQMRLQRAIAKADNMKALTGNKFLVLRWKNDLVVKSKKQLKNAIKSHQLKCTIMQLEEMALYITK